jgi:hypothetical protein
MTTAAADKQELALLLLMYLRRSGRSGTRLLINTHTPLSRTVCITALGKVWRCS